MYAFGEGAGQQPRVRLLVGFRDRALARSDNFFGEPLAVVGVGIEGARGWCRGTLSASGEHRSGAISTVGPAVALFRQLSLPR